MPRSEDYIQENYTREPIRKDLLYFRKNRVESLLQSRAMDSRDRDNV